MIVAVVTSNLRLADAPGNVELPADVGGLHERSVANVSQIATVNRWRLRRRMGRVPAAVLAQIEQGARFSLALA